MLLLNFAILLYAFVLVFVIKPFLISLIDFNKNACRDFAYYPIAFISRECYKNPQIEWTTPEVIKSNGFNLSRYNVVTPDGYILTLFRIPPSSDDFRKNKQPVFLQHGISSSSYTWVDVRNRSLAFNLARRGYDVWLGNLRGTQYSRGHLKYSDTDMEFWSFNLDTLAANDIRYSLKKVADETGQAGSIIYIGHSLGTTLVFMYASDPTYNQEANSLLKGIVAAAPVIYFDPNLAPKFLPIILLFGRVLLFNSFPTFYSHPEQARLYFQNFCKYLPFLCLRLLEFQYGTSGQLLPDDLLLYYASFPDTISVEQLMHYGQILETGNFQKYSYGSFENIIEYGQVSPPMYNLSNVKVPVCLFYGKNDNLMSEKGLRRALSELGSDRKYLYSVPRRFKKREMQFNHMDFTFSKYLQQFFYRDLFKFMDQHLTA